MYVFIKLHITTQSGPVILVILCHSYVCMYVCMYVFIKLHITVCMYVCMYVCMVITYSKGEDQPGKVANLLVASSFFFLSFHLTY